MDFFKIVYDYVFILQLATVCGALLIVFYPFKKTVKSAAIAVAHFAVLFGAATMLNWGLFALSTVWHFLGGINFQIAYLILIIVYLSINRIYMMSRIIMGATLYASIIAICDFGRYILYFIPGNGNYGFLSIFFYMFIIAYSFVLHHYTLKYYSDLPKVSVVMIMINTVSLSSLVIANTIISVKEGKFGADIFYVLTLVVIYILSVSGYMMIYFHCKVRKAMTELQVENKLLEADKQMLAVSEQAISEMRSMRHDIKNQLKVMELMLADKKYAELQEYFKSMNETFIQDSGSTFIDSGNALINSVVNMEILKANKFGIQLATKISVPQELPFEHSDLCRILVNLLDNAIEGILRAEDKSYLIDCKIIKRADYLYICVCNQIRDDVDRNRILQMNTEKEDVVNHGFGHRIVKRMAEKYNGYVNYTVEENEFIAEVMLDCAEAHK